MNRRGIRKVPNVRGVADTHHRKVRCCRPRPASEVREAHHLGLTSARYGSNGAGQSTGATIKAPAGAAGTKSVLKHMNDMQNTSSSTMIWGSGGVATITTEILFADDDPAMRQLVAETLRTGRHEVRLARNGQEALEEVRRSPPDLVMLDYRMGVMDGFQVCRQLKADPRFDHLPILILTAEGRIEDRLTGFDAGADDYLPKPFDPRELLARVAALLRLAQRGLDRNPTSGLAGGEAIGREYARRQAASAAFAVCYLDLDEFKAFNDRFGFSVADAVIREVGRVLRTVSEGSDAFVGHVGGDDFIMLCLPEDAVRLTGEIQNRFRHHLARHLPAKVIQAGRYVNTDKRGRAREYAVPRLSTAILQIPADAGVAFGVLGELAAGVKVRAKQAAGAGIVEVEIRP